MTLLLAAPRMRLPRQPLSLPAVMTPEPPVGCGLDYVWHCDALTLLRALPTGSVNCVVTSPPYFGLRDYGVDGQIGLEPTPAAFVAVMVEVFREVRRVLRDDGTCWINFGDSYANDEKWGGATGGKHVSNLHGDTGIGRRKRDTGLASKNLFGIPWRVAFALQDDGWILRSDIIWHKPNPMPESVTDRPTKAHEYVFLMTKSPRYWYDADAIRENFSDERNGDPGKYNRTSQAAKGANRDRQDTGFLNNGAGWTHGLELGGRNARSVWTVATEPTPFAHFATFPQKLITPMILAGCPDKTCAACGKPWARVVEASGGTIGKSWHPHGDDLGRGMSQYSGLSGGVGNAQDGNGKRYTRETVAWQPTCTCHAPTVPGVVLDPFMGSGTVALVARHQGRHYIGSDLNAEYVALARARLRDTDPLQDRHVAPNVVQHSLFAEVK